MHSSLLTVHLRAPLAHVWGHCPYPLPGTGAVHAAIFWFPVLCASRATYCVCFVCVCVSVCVRVCVCAYVHMCVCLCTCVCVCMFIQKYMCKLVCVCMYTCVGKSVCAVVCVCVCIRVCAKSASLLCSFRSGFQPWRPSVY